MPAAPRSVVAFRDALGIAPSPRWTVETALIDAALALGDTPYNGPQTILRRARERAAWRATPTIAPTLDELRSALHDGDEEGRTQLLARLLVAELEQITKGSDEPGSEGGRSLDPPPRTGDGP